MPRKSDRKATVESPILSKQQQLAQQEAQLKAQLDETRSFLKKAPVLKDEAQKKQQQEILDRFNRPTQIEGPANFRLNFDSGKPTPPPRKLRKERSKAPLVTLALLVTFVVVLYFAWKSIWQG